MAQRGLASSVTSKLLCVGPELAPPTGRLLRPGLSITEYCASQGAAAARGEELPKMPWHVRRGRGGPLVRKGLLCMGQRVPIPVSVLITFYG